MLAEHMVSLSIGRHQIFDGTLPVGLGVVVLHVPGIVGHTIQCHLRCLGILHGVARKCRHFGTKGVVALVVAVELAHEHVADAIVVNRIVKPDKRSHTVGGRLKEVQVALVNHVGHTGTSPHYLDALAQSVAQAAQIGIGIVVAGISGVVLCRTHRKLVQVVVLQYEVVPHVVAFGHLQVGVGCTKVVEEDGEVAHAQ